MNRRTFTPPATVEHPTPRDIERVRAYVECSAIVLCEGDPPFAEAVGRVLAVCEAFIADRASAEALVNMTFNTQGM